MDPGTKRIGYDVGFCGGTDQYLYDREGKRHPDLVSGFGVFAIGAIICSAHGLEERTEQRASQSPSNGWVGTLRCPSPA
jgi:acetylornithine/succinyldiaminopimelate/putrescine aminotransferase